LNVPVIRDGRPFPADSVENFKLFDDAAAACRALHAAGSVLVVVTNQPDVGRGTLARTAVEAIHARLRELIPEIARVEACYAPGQGVASPDDRRRKPEPGMLHDAAAALGLDLARSWMIGDRWRDIDCGHRAGVRTVFIDLGYREELREAPTFKTKSIGEAAAIVIAQGRP
jgi:D-glycero-D-manno-heptose 1,7-bisphosphate phosphatase